MVNSSAWSGAKARPGCEPTGACENRGLAGEEDELVPAFGLAERGGLKVQPRHGQPCGCGSAGRVLSRNVGTVSWGTSVWPLLNHCSLIVAEHVVVGHLQSPLREGPAEAAEGWEPMSFQRGLLSPCCCWLCGSLLECVALSGLYCIMQATHVILELRKIYSPHFLPLMKTICVCVKGTVCQEGMQKGEIGKAQCQRSISFLFFHLLFHLVKANTGLLLKFHIFCLMSQEACCS